MRDGLKKQIRYPIRTDCLTDIADAQGDWVLVDWRVKDAGLVVAAMAVVEVKSMQRDLTLDLEVQHTGVLEHKVLVGDLFRAGDIIGSVVTVAQATRLPKPPDAREFSNLTNPANPANPANTTQPSRSTEYSKLTKSPEDMHIEQLFPTQKVQDVVEPEDQQESNTEAVILHEEDIMNVESQTEKLRANTSASEEGSTVEYRAETGLTEEPTEELDEEPSDRPKEQYREEPKVSLDHSQLQLICLTVLIIGAFLGVVLSSDDVSRYMSAALMLVLVHPFCKRYFNGEE